MMIIIVKLFSYSIEKISDEDDEEVSAESREKQMRRAFLENPLLLEQYEAQFFSIIRQNLQNSTSYGVLNKNLKLIHLFLTLPICKDRSTIGKIVTMLMEHMTSGTDFFNDSSFKGMTEKVITDIHFKKLTLLAKLLL